MVTPVNVDQLEALLKETGYDTQKTQFLVDSFRNGFKLRYEGNKKVKMKSPNLKFRGVGDEITLWNKVMKEVKMKRYAGPFEEIPFEYFIQSPIGLVPKDNGKNTRLIFHLSYPRGKGVSVNECTNKNACSMQYPDFSDAVLLCINAGVNCKMAKSDMTSAFGHLGMSVGDFCYLVMKAKHPKSGVWYYFVDKCLPFGASISCSHFQAFSNAIAHIIVKKTGKNLINYLDDYFFVALLRLVCNNQVQQFLQICSIINFPVSLEKTFWGTTQLVFLGLLIDSALQLVCVPKEKVIKALNMIDMVLLKPSGKITLNQLQKICGILNFLSRAIVPGCVFTRRLYMHTANPKLKPHHHIRIMQDMRDDLQLWQEFLRHPSVYCRPFMEFTRFYSATEVDLYSDASKNPLLGMGGMCETAWMSQQWNANFITEANPSIEYLELFALLATVTNWIHKFRNKRIILFCDNTSVVFMVNNTSSSCKNCMVLIRKLVMLSLVHNVRIYTRYVSSKENLRADLLSRLKLDIFKNRFPFVDPEPTMVPADLWPMEKLWIY